METKRLDSRKNGQGELKDMIVTFNSFRGWGAEKSTFKLKIADTICKTQFSTIHKVKRVEQEGKEQTLKIFNINIKEKIEKPGKYFERELLNHIKASESARILSIIDYGTIKLAGIQYFALLREWADFTLSDLLSRKKLSLKEVLQIFSSVVDGVRDLHRTGIVHKDLKPQNIFLIKASHHNDNLEKITIDRQDYYTLVGDLGISLGEKEENTTREYAYTLSYSPDERFYFDKVKGEDRKKYDVFALAVILYEMLLGEYPFKDTTVPNVDKLISLREKNEEVPFWLEEVVKLGMIHDYKDRVDTPADLYDLVLNSFNKRAIFINRKELPQRELTKYKDLGSITSVKEISINNSIRFLYFPGFNDVDIVKFPFTIGKVYKKEKNITIIKLDWHRILEEAAAVLEKNVENIDKLKFSGIFTIAGGRRKVIFNFSNEISNKNKKDFSWL